MSDEAVLNPLFQIAHDLVLGAEGRVPMLSGHPDIQLTRQQVEQHGAYAAFLQALEPQPDFQEYFVRMPEGIPAHWWKGGGLPPGHLATGLIRAAVWHMAFAGGEGDALLGQLQRAFDARRLSLKRKPSSSIMLIGLAVKLQRKCPAIETRFGLLRPRVQGDDVAILPMTGDYHLPPVDEARAAMLEMPINCLWTEGMGTSPELDRDSLNLLKLAIVLTLRDTITRSVPAWFLTWLHPAAEGSSSGCYAGGEMSSGSWPLLRIEQMNAVQELCAALSARPISAIAVRRTLSMMERSSEHVDAFIDAVIVWESLFSGSGDGGGLTYRVSMNMACVLTTDAAKRARLQEEISGLYDHRSRILHGQVPRDFDEARDRKRAQELTLDAFARLVLDYPQLVGVKAPEFARFVLGAPPPPPQEKPKKEPKPRRRGRPR